MPNDWALVVGINRYPNAAVDPLEGAVRDAQDFYDWVIDPLGGNVDSEHVRLLQSPDPGDAHASRPKLTDLLSFFEDVIDTLGGHTGGRLYIYLSGHGISRDGVEAALLTANARAPRQWFNFPGGHWAEGARKAAAFREVVLIMDCCRDLKNNAAIIDHYFGEQVVDGKDCRLLKAYATEWGSNARELPFPPTNEKHGVFTRALLQVLRAGRMDGSQLQESMLHVLEKLLEDQKKPQQAQVEGDLEIVFNEQAPSPRTPVSIQGAAAARPVIEQFPEGDGDTVPVPLDGWSHNGAAWQGTLEPGIYLLEVPGQNRRRLNVYAGLPVEV